MAKKIYRIKLPPSPPKKLILAEMPGPGLKEAKSGVKSKKVLMTWPVSNPN